MRQKETLMFLNIAHFFDHFFLLIFPTASIAIAAEWDMSYSAVLAMGTPLYVAFAVATLPAGWLGDRFARTYLIACFFIGGGAASLLISFSSGPVSLMAGLALLGLFAALYHPIGLALVPELAARTGRALAVNGVFGNLGLAAAAAVTGVLAQYGGWQNAFLAPGVAGLVVGGLLLLRRWRLGAAATHAAVKSRVAGEAIVRRTQINVFAVVCVAALFGGFVFNAVTVSMPKFFDERLVMLAGDLTWIGASTGIVFGIAAFAQLASGELLDRFGARPVLICLVSGQIVLLVCLSLVEGWAVVPLALLAVILIFAEIPITTWLLGRYVQSGLRSRAVSVEYVLALGVGSAVVPIIAAMHGIGLGFDIQFLALGACATMVFTAAWFLPRLRNN